MMFPEEKQKLHPDSLTEPERVVRQSIRHQRDGFRKWMIRTMIGAGIWMTAETRPGGELQDFPIPFKASVPLATTMWILVAVYNGKSKKFTKDQLDVLAMQGELEKTLRQMTRENPDLEDRLISIGLQYDIQL